jgi:hypothetical protein
MWYLATNEVDIFHYGELFEGAVIQTGQPKLEYFDTKTNLANKLKEYGQEFIDPTLQNDFPPEPLEN